jgi:hypothetical protein
MRFEWAYKGNAKGIFPYPNGDSIVAERQTSRLPEEVTSKDSSANRNSTRCRALSTGRGVRKCGRRKPIMHETPTLLSSTKINFYAQITRPENERKSHLWEPSLHLRQLNVPLGFIYFQFHLFNNLRPFHKNDSPVGFNSGDPHLFGSVDQAYSNYSIKNLPFDPI